MMEPSFSPDRHADAGHSGIRPMAESLRPGSSRPSPDRRIAMRPTIRGIRGFALAALTAASLAFGARAAPAPMQTCADPTAQGSCSSTSDCRKICNRLSNGLIPVCDTQSHCCTCQKL